MIFVDKSETPRFARGIIEGVLVKGTKWREKPHEVSYGFFNAGPTTTTTKRKQAA